MAQSVPAPKEDFAVLKFVTLAAAMLALAPLGPLGCPPIEDPNDTELPERGTLAVTATAPSAATIGETVSLQATLNSSAQGAVQYAWLQSAGAGVRIANPDQASASFTAPSLPARQTLRFIVTATDEAGAVGRAEVAIAVAADPNYGTDTSPPARPVADAGNDQKTVPGTLITLDGSASTGINLEGEQTGVVPSPAWKKKAFKRREAQVWFPGETVIAGIGQGYVLTTPLQLAHATATIAARGKRFKPTLLKGARDPATDVIEYQAPKPLPAVDDQNALHWDAIIEGMHGVMQGPRGTARAVGARAAFPIAGKSGTAQVFSVAQGQKYKASEVDERRRDHALFIAFAPLDAPRIAVAVVIENGESGSKAAAPIALDVINAYLKPAPAT